MLEAIANKKAPNSIVFVMLSNLDYIDIQENESFKEFYDFIFHTEKSGRLYKISSLNNQICNWLSIFTGQKPELTGIKGNVLLENKNLNLDSFFKKLKKQHIRHKIFSKQLFIFFS